MTYFIAAEKESLCVVLIIIPELQSLMSLYRNSNSLPNNFIHCAGLDALEVPQKVRTPGFTAHGFSTPPPASFI